MNIFPTSNLSLSLMTSSSWGFLLLNPSHSLPINSNLFYSCSLALILSRDLFVVMQLAVYPVRFANRFVKDSFLLAIVGCLVEQELSEPSRQPRIKQVTRHAPHLLKSQLR